MNHEESHIQRTCVGWFRLAHACYWRLLIAVPNGGKRNAREAAIMKAEGVVAGVADLLLLLPRRGYSLLAVEMKTATGRQSPNQKEWQEVAEANGVLYKVVRSFDEFRELVEWYLKC